MSVVALAAVFNFAIAPATAKFLCVFFLPVLLAALFGGLGPGILAMASQTLGAAYIVGASFNGVFHGLVGLAVAWIASSSHRARARPEVLGWSHSKPWMGGWGERLVWQSGETGGYASFIGLDQKRNVAVIVLANCAKPVSDLGHRALKALSEGET